ncbi:unnamed protein product [Schistosoma mattheei]|uniref:Uncharacterized protein n=1 Tax=Schistosoma mattheei TaxID=31246 RepID=A0A183PX39_9TREM|nr:unnamed protein product [Schistosoma mattheei]
MILLNYFQLIKLFIYALNQNIFYQNILIPSIKLI